MLIFHLFRLRKPFIQQNTHNSSTKQKDLGERNVRVVVFVDSWSSRLISLHKINNHHFKKGCREVLRAGGAGYKNDMRRVPPPLNTPVDGGLERVTFAPPATKAEAGGEIAPR